VHVPVVASPTAAFREVIENGVTGLLANTATEWFEALQRLTLEPSLRENIATAAHAAVVKRYSTQAQCKALREMLDQLGVIKALPAEPLVPVVQRPLPNTPPKPRAPMPRLVLLLPDISPGSGGHRKALTWCHHYVRIGGQVTVLFMSSRSDAELREIVERYFFADCGDIRAYDGMEPQADVAVATSWPTAYAIARWTNVPRRCYFVQDFEPMFSPMSTDYVLAYHSYRLGLQPVVFGDWNSRMLKKEFGVTTRGIRFPVDREVYSPVAGVPRENIILFYARPSQPRRLYELGYHALRQLRAFLPDYRFVFFGEEIPGLAVDGFECVGKQTDLAELAKLYSKARIGLAFSSTNPSLIPYEMLSCGLPVVDITLGQESDDFAGCSALLRCPPTVEDVMREIYRLAQDLDRCRLLSEQALAWAKGLPNDLQYAQAVLAELGLMSEAKR
jgi:glycosyltransferase involved in cell wall biosynthesis